ncbi:MAG TPA: twin transmembrane helix small protein [Gammaproteobacteria bacterium]|nr:twin transmembrane helix small protein [Gammaproteobacteria bacterium]
MLVKIVVVGLLLVVIGSLGSGLYFLLKDPPGSNRALRALSWRIGLSVAAFALLMLAAWAGWIQPNSVMHGG